MDLENKKIRTLSILSKLIEDAHNSGLYDNEINLINVREFIKKLEILHFKVSINNYAIAKYPKEHKNFLDKELSLSIAEQISDKITLTKKEDSIIDLSGKSDYYAEFGIMTNE